MYAKGHLVLKFVQAHTQIRPIIPPGAHAGRHRYQSTGRKIIRWLHTFVIYKEKGRGIPFMLTL